MPPSQVPQSSPQRPRTLGVDKGLLEVPWEWHGRWDVRDLFSEKGRLPPKWHRNQQEGPKPETLDGGEGGGGVLGADHRPHMIDGKETRTAVGVQVGRVPDR